MSNDKPTFSDEERKLLDAPAVSPDAKPVAKPARKKVDEAKAGDEAKASQEKGPLTPAQFDDDGWGDTPVQMRG